MEFYKKRNFGDLIGDTFAFIKKYGKNYFKNYILLNGLLLILFVVIIAFGYREIFSQIFGSNVGGENYYFQQYFQENQVMLILVGLALFILFLAVSVINYSYPVFYMKRLSETGNGNIKADEILSDIKNNGKRIFILFLGLFFFVTPLAIVIFGISYLLMFLIIGFFMMIIIGPALVNIINFLLFDYLNTKRGFFESLSYAIRAQFSYSQLHEKTPFWKYWGTTIVNYIIIQVITSVFTIIPMILIFASVYSTNVDATKSGSPFDGATGILIFVFYGIAILISIILTNLIYISSGLMYYDSRTDLHQSKDLQEIETIGKDEV